MSAIGSERSFAAEHTRNSFGGSCYAESEADSFSVVFWVEDGAFVDTQRPQPVMIVLSIGELTESTAVGGVASVLKAAVVHREASGVED